MDGKITTVKAFGEYEADEFGVLTMKFSQEALKDFISLLNMNKLVNHRGSRLTFNVHEYGKGDVVLEVTEHTE